MDEVLFYKYKFYFIKKLNNYLDNYRLKLDKDDIEQELYIVFNKMVRNYNKDKATLLHYLNMYLVKNTLRTILRKYSKDLIKHPYKHFLKYDNTKVKDYISIYSSANSEDCRQLQIVDTKQNIDDYINSKIELNHFLNKVDKIIKKKRNIHLLKEFILEGKTIDNIAKETKTTSANISQIISKNMKRIENKMGIQFKPLRTINAFNKRNNTRG